MSETGRPSGRCAARDALVEDWRQRAAEAQDPMLRSALRICANELAAASPCCGSAADQEQVKEALKRARPYVAVYYRARAERDRPPEDLNVIDAALALLGSNEEEEETP